jgi:hypothetical protein
MARGVRIPAVESSFAAATAIGAQVRAESKSASTSNRYSGDGLSARRIPASSA